MQTLKRLLYLGYYVRNTDWKVFFRFLKEVVREKKRSRTAVFTDVVFSSLKYNISLLEYFYFRFYDSTPEKRRQYAGTGYMYEYQLAMNPPAARACLDDKISFYELYAPFVRHRVASLNSMKKEPGLGVELLKNSSGKIVLKDSHGKCGAQVRVYKTTDFKNHDIQEEMLRNGFDLAEEYIVQHPDLMRMSPAAVNTVRIFTQLNSAGRVEYLGARLRISINSPVDNLAAGNIAAPIDIESGVISGPGVYSDITKPDVFFHPVTGVEIVGFKIPFWPEIKTMIEKAALHNPANRSVGWDIAVTSEGPELIEGNHDWCKLVWQLPVKKGMKQVLEKHFQEYTN